jgi:hypothetical protein
MTPSSIDLYVDRIRELEHPSLIVIVSISEVFLETARAILAPFTGSLHAIETYDLNMHETCRARTSFFAIPFAAISSTLRTP